MAPEASLLRPPSPSKGQASNGSLAPIRSAAASTFAAVAPRRKFTPVPKAGSLASQRKASNASSVRSISSASSSRSASATHSSTSDAHFATPKSSIVSLRKAAAAAVSQLPSSPTKHAERKFFTSPQKATTASVTSPAKTSSKIPAAGVSLKTGASEVPNEPIKAFLRIRPTPQDETSMEQKQPYIEVVSDTEVLMNPPRDASAPRARVYSSSVPTKFAFSRVFRGDAKEPEETSQSSFFQSTTLPLVDELLQGQSGLIFTYGVTNSGKSYTVQGNSGHGQAGILPRSMDVIFNSIAGLESTSEIRPVGLSGVEHATSDGTEEPGTNPFSLPGLSKKFRDTPEPLVYEHDDTKVRVDRNYRYSVWVSYIEIYNEKIFDLLDAAPQTTASSSGMVRSPSTFGARTEGVRGLANWSLAPSENASGPIYLQRRPLPLKNDIEAGGKYVAGLHEIRVSSSAEAHELLRRGQENRRVFATMANRTSSRSHGVFTVKIIREHAGEDDLSVACSTSRLSIVDLAGSERLSNTSASGDRLKEAGNINKSLMCLGQCLETLRKNQSRAMAAVPMLETASGKATPSSGSNLPRIINRRPSLVPFRHSKLTELFQSFFMGEGRAVMIVNVNPYDTGFDENSHVMRFSAAAKEVHTVRTQGHATNLSRFVHPSLRNLFTGGSATAVPPPMPLANGSPSGLKSPPLSSPRHPPARVASREPWSTTITSPPQTPRSNAIATMPPPPIVFAHQPQISTKSKESSVQAAPEQSDSMAESKEITILEGSDDEEDTSESDPFVELLMQKYEELRHMLFESEMRCAAVEREVREEMAEEMSERLLEMERRYNERMLADAEQNEDFINRKLDLLARASSFGPQVEREAQPASDVIFADDSVLSSFVDDSNDDSRLVENSLAPGVVSESRRVESTGEESVDVSNAAEDNSHLSTASETAEYDIADESSMLSAHTADGANTSDASASVTADESAVTTASASGLDAGQVTDDDSQSRDLDSEEETLSDDDPDADGVDQDEDCDNTADEDELSDEDISEEQDTSDESFDVSEESIESSFEAPPKARTSRARQSAAARGRASTAVRRPGAATRALAQRPAAKARERTGAKSAPPTRSSRPKGGKGSNIGPLSESTLNSSQMSASPSEEFRSDSSIILAPKTPSKTKKSAAMKDAEEEEEEENDALVATESPSKSTTSSPKKKRMLGPIRGGRRTNPMSREALALEQNSDISLMEAMQRRIVS